VGLYLIRLGDPEMKRPILKKPEDHTAATLQLQELLKHTADDETKFAKLTGPNIEEARSIVKNAKNEGGKFEDLTKFIDEEMTTLDSAHSNLDEIHPWDRLKFLLNAAATYVQTRESTRGTFKQLVQSATHDSTLSNTQYLVKQYNEWSPKEPQSLSRRIQAAGEVGDKLGGATAICCCGLFSCVTTLCNAIMGKSNKTGEREPLKGPTN
jgi:hypothetical protein